MAALLQFEMSLGSAKGFPSEAQHNIRSILTAALSDTIRNGGTFVCVRSDTTITAIQHDKAEDLPVETNEESA